MEKNIRTAKSAKWDKGVSLKFYAQVCQQVSSVAGLSKALSIGSEIGSYL